MLARVLSLALTLALSLCLNLPGNTGGTTPSDADGTTEYQLKAAFIYKFTRYIDWPATALPPERKNIIIGIVGADPFGDALSQVEGKTVKDRTILIKRFADAKSIESCDLLFIPASEKDHIADIVKAMRGMSTVLVGEHANATLQGCMIGFYIENKKLRFEINTDNASAGSFKLSSQLLGVARIVKNPDLSRPADDSKQKPASRPAGEKGKE